MKSFFNSEKGFIISLDSMFALLVLLTIFVTATFYLGRINSDSASIINLRETALDTITVLDKSGQLSEAIIQNDFSGLRSFLNKLPHSLCADLRIYNRNNLSVPEANVLRIDCKKNFNDSATIKRTVIVKESSQSSIYLAEIILWYRGE